MDLARSEQFGKLNSAAQKRVVDDLNRFHRTPSYQNMDVYDIFKNRESLLESVKQALVHRELNPSDSVFAQTLERVISGNISLHTHVKQPNRDARIPGHVWDHAISVDRADISNNPQRFISNIKTLADIFDQLKNEKNRAVNNGSSATAGQQMRLSEDVRAGQGGGKGRVLSLLWRLAARGLSALGRR